MSRPLRSGAAPALSLAILVSLALAGPAWGGEGTGARRFGLPPSNGYEIGVYARGATVDLGVVRHERGRRATAASFYFARGRPSADRIQASFGALGSVSMRFEPSGRVVRGRPGHDCKGPSQTTTRFGVFVGSLRFRGEGGYVSVRVHRAKGRLESPPSPDCAGSGAQDPQGGDALSRAKRLTSFEAGFRRGVGAVYFGAKTDRAHRARYFAIAEQTEGQLGIYRSAYAGASPQSFATDNALSFASLTPPPPFSGTGSLRRNADGSRTWTGSLAVSFPGDPDVPLTGAQFKTTLTRHW